jgi:7-alpha-hydroxysteroid dehydrogenase
MSLRGKAAIVTGAGKGIGRACALALAQAGADVALAARTQADLDALAREIEALGRRALPLACDVGDEAALRTLVARTRESFGRIDVLINNAGGGGPNDARKSNPADFGHMLSWNVVPAFTLIQLCAPLMREGGYGAVVNISSVAARYAQRGFSANGAAKAALNQMTRNLAQDFGPHLRINAIEPGTIETEALAPYLTPERRERMVSTTPLQRLGQPEDIANAAVFLASPAASWITGKVLGVDGGVEAPNF